MKNWVARTQKLLVKTSFRQDLCALFIITSVVLLGNIVWVSGYRNPNPMLTGAGLASYPVDNILPGTFTTDANISATTQALGGAAAHALLHGHLPYWNYYEGVGSPLAGEMQSAAFLPTTLLLVFSNGVLYEHLILEIIAGFFTYLFIKRLGLRSRVALLAGVMFALNGTFAWLENAAFNPIAFLPVMLYGFEALLLIKSKSKTWLWLPVGLALSLYAGFPETAFLDFLLVIIWVLARLWQTRPTVSRGQVTKICLAFLSGAFLAAPILILFADYLPHAYVGIHSNILAHDALKPIALPSKILPYAYGNINYSSWNLVSSDGGYIPITIVLLAIVGLFSRTNIKLKLALFFWIIACLLKSFGFGPAVAIWNLVPTIKSAAVYRYCLPSVYFAATVLAAFGLQELVARTISKKRLLYSYITFSVTFALALALIKHNYYRITPAPSHKLFVELSVFWGFAVSFLLATAIIVVKRKYLYLIIFLIVLGDVGLMFAIPTLSTPKQTIDYSPVQFLQKNLGTNRYYTLGPLGPNYGSYFNISEVATNDLPLPTLWENFYTKQLDKNASVIALDGTTRNDANGPPAFSEFLRNERNFEYIGTKYLLTWNGQLSGDQVSEAGLEKVYNNSILTAYLLPHSLPYYQLPKDCRLGASVTLSSATIICQGSGATVVRKELYMPGWKVSVNGKPQVLQESDNLFQAVKLAKGTNRLSFSFDPPYILEAWLLFAFGTALLVYGLCIEKAHTALKVVHDRFANNNRA